MHKYLEAIGFSEYQTRSKVGLLIKEVVEHFDERIPVPDYDDGTYVEYIKYFSNNIGVAVCGQFDSVAKYHVEFYYPFVRDTKITTTLPLTVERHYDKSSFAAACDDLRLGVTLIFYLQRPAEYMKLNQKLGSEDNPIPIVLTGLAYEGCILFPLEKDKEEVLVEKEHSKNRSELMAAAMDGDEDAIESLSREEMDTYTMIAERIQSDDVFTIVDSYFMPYGIECDQYNIMGDILHLEFVNNQMTGEELVRMTVDCNDIEYDIVINSKRLLGEPRVGRRFKGIIWLQGRIDYNVLDENNAHAEEDVNM